MINVRVRRLLPMQRSLHAALGLCLGALPLVVAAQARLPVEPQWREQAQQVAQAGVPLADLAPNAPDSHTVQPGDTLWGISTLFLKSPWRWPELWGMNLQQIRNPHLIYPGQVLTLERKDGRATLRMGEAGGVDAPPTGTVKLSPRVRSTGLPPEAITTVPVHLIGPFLNEAVVVEAGELDSAPRIVATQEGRVLLSRGDTAYVRGDLAGARDFRVFREAKPLVDPVSREVLGYEARYVGRGELVQRGGERDGTPVPDSFRIQIAKLEAKVGDRLSPVPQQELVSYVPHPPAGAVEGRVIGIYGEELRAGQNQIVALNLGRKDGLERGHVLALWRAGRDAVDRTDGRRESIRLPDERHGVLFVFRTFERVSYALILNAREPVRTGDRFTQP